MGVRKYKPSSPGRRFQTVSDFAEITTTTPEKSLLEPLPKKAGRNNYGRITTRHQGGGHKRKYRKIDFKRRKDGIPAKVASIEYDPNRSARIALLNYADGAKAYILQPRASRSATPSSPVPRLTSSRVMPCRWPTSPSARSCTPSSSSRARVPPWRAAPVRASSSWARRVATPSCVCRAPRCAASCSTARATVGEVGNAEHSNIRIGKAGRKRWMGVRPTVRGTVMNPVDHPHGGGEGKNKSAGRHPVTPWGIPTKGHRTRNPKKASGRLIIRRRKK